LAAISQNRSRPLKTISARITVGIRKASTPEAVPKALVASMALPKPASTSKARPAEALRLAIAGTDRKAGVDRKVTQAAHHVPPASQAI
jgi:hypothetical protein